MKKFIKEFGYKSFTKDLTSHFSPAKWQSKDNKRGEATQYEFGTVFHKPYKVGPLFSPDGFHFHKTVKGCTENFLHKKDSRICLIKCLGKTQHEYSQSITQAFIIVRELTTEEIQEMVKKDTIEESLNNAYRSLNINLIRKIQTKFPTMILCGSAALFFHGIILERSKSSTASSDIDAVFPYYIPLEGIHSDFEISISDEERGSGADFVSVFNVDGVKMDTRIEPKEPYQVINFDGFDFKVSRLETIMEAKWRYAIAGSKKHLKDCYEISGKSKPVDFEINRLDSFQLLF